MKHLLETATKTVKALDVSKERAKMSPERAKAQVRGAVIALVAFTAAGLIAVFTDAQWYVWAGFAGYGLFALDPRLLKDFAVGLGQFIRTIRGGSDAA